MFSKRLAILLLTATAVITSPYMASARPVVTEVTTQLPRTARPLHYAVHIQPDATKLGFEGHVTIDIEVLKPTNALTLNAAELDFKSAGIVNGAAAKVSIDAAAQTATLTFPAPLKAGRATLDISYSGKIYKQANGLFALDYKNPQGENKRALFTQFEAADARRFVPSWDEPNFRTSFDLSATIPSALMAISNMPVASRRDLPGGLSEVAFQTTPKMSTYLLFFGLGEFDRITKQVGKTEVGVVMGRGNADKAHYALEAASKVVPFYNDYFGVTFPLPKLDNIAGPGQSQFFSAMENWGAIFTFEASLLDDPKITSMRGRQRIYSIAGHEIAHQWFGDLVTMQWWDDLWLNEGFASWIETKATAHFNPDWHYELTRVGGRERAMGLDAYVTTHPIIQHIATVEQTSQAFDSITYQKGEAVIAMLEGFAGETVWRNGIRAYMKKHAFSNTRTDDLWAAVEGVGAKGITRIAHDFTKQPGIPMIRVTSSVCQGGITTLSLAQGEFSRDRKAQTDSTPKSWNVPVIAQILGRSPARTIISGGKGSLTLPGCGTILINAGQSGYYRTVYTAPMQAALKSNFGKLAAIDQLGLLGDTQQLSNGDYQPMDAALDLLSVVPSDATGPVAEAAANSWNGYYDRFKGDDSTQSAMASRVSRAFNTRLQALGFAPKAGEPVEDALLRTSLIGILGGFGDPAVKGEAQRLFASLDTNPAALDGAQRQTWLSIVAFHADKATWDKIHAQAQAATGQVVKAATYRLLGAVKDEDLARQALDLSLTDEPGPTTSAAIIGAVASVHPDLAVDFALAHLDKVVGLVDVSSQSRYIGELAGGSRDPAMIGKLDAYAKDHLTPQSRGSVDKAIASIRARLASEPRIKAGVSAWLGRNP